MMLVVVCELEEDRSLIQVQKFDDHICKRTSLDQRVSEEETVGSLQLIACIKLMCHCLNFCFELKTDIMSDFI